MGTQILCQVSRCFCSCPSTRSAPAHPWQHSQVLTAPPPVWVITTGSDCGPGEYMLQLHEPGPANGHPSSKPCVGPHSDTTSIFHPTSLREGSRKRQQNWPGLSQALTPKRELAPASKYSCQPEAHENQQSLKTQGEEACLKYCGDILNLQGPKWGAERQEGSWP